MDSPALPPPARWLGHEPTLFAFDFDGTLVELAPEPEAVRREPEVFAALATLAERPPVGAHVLVCSGRSLADLSANLPVSLDLIGSHGLQWRRFGVEQDWVTQDWWGWRHRYFAELQAAVDRWGGRLEDKRVSLTVHYRGVPSFWSEPEGLHWLRALAGESVGLMPGTLTWNLVGFGQAPGMPAPARMTKGESVIAFAWQIRARRLVYFGDEATDETVFMRKEVPVAGVHIGEGETAALYRLPDVRSVQRWLQDLARCA